MRSERLINILIQSFDFNRIFSSVKVLRYKIKNEED